MITIGHDGVRCGQVHPFGTRWMLSRSAARHSYIHVCADYCPLDGYEGTFASPCGACQDGLLPCSQPHHAAVPSYPPHDTEGFAAEPRQERARGHALSGEELAGGGTDADICPKATHSANTHGERHNGKGLPALSVEPCRPARIRASRRESTRSFAAIPR